jgi:AcrR family transcriptional regulator
MTKAAANLNSNARDELKKAAMKLFAKKGFYGTSTREIARESGQNISLISYYFGGKEGLYESLFKDFANEVSNVVETVLETANDKKQSEVSVQGVLFSMLSSVVDLKVAHPEMVILFQRELVSGMPVARSIYEQTFGSTGQKIIKFMKQAQAQGLIRNDIDASFMFMLLGEAVNSYFVAHNCGMNLAKNCYPMPEKKKEFVESVLSIFLKGIRA